MASRETLERTVLSALLQGSVTPLAVADGVRAGDFAPGPRGAIAAAVYSLMDARWQERDRVAAVAARLAEEGQLDAVGGQAELAALAAGLHAEEEIARASEALIGRTDLERLAEAGSRIGAAAAAGRNPERAWLEAEHALLEALPRSARWERAGRARVLIYPALEKIEQAQARLRGERVALPALFPFGIRVLDEKLGGLAGPELTLVLAPHGWARAIAWQAALAAASGAQRRVILASDEPQLEFVSRAIAWLGGSGDPLRARGELTAGALRRLAAGTGALNKLQLNYVTPPVTGRLTGALRAQVDVQQPRLLVIDEVRGLGRGYRAALLRLRQLCRADGSRLLVAMETDREAAALDPFFPNLRSRRVAELATRIVRFHAGPPRTGTMRVLDRMLGIELSVRVRIPGPELRIVARSAGGGSGRGSGRV